MKALIVTLLAAASLSWGIVPALAAGPHHPHHHHQVAHGYWFCQPYLVLACPVH